MGDVARVRGAWRGGGARDAGAVIAALAFVGYLAVAGAVTNLFPFSTFPMYSGAHTDSSSRIAARSADGRLREVTEYARWDCPSRLDVESRSCAAYGRFYAIPYLDAEAAAHVDQHQAHLPHAATVDVVRHIWRLTPGAEREEDCVVATCRAEAH